MNRVGIVSYNLHYNYSNYGSILQTYALQEYIKENTKIEPVIIDYCPDAFKNSNPQNPLSLIYDKTADFYRTCLYLLNDIKSNESEIRRFVLEHYKMSSVTYYKETFEESLNKERLFGYICGSDAIWSYEYFKLLDDAFYGNYDCMRNTYTISYAASFGETIFTDEQRVKMLERMKNFKAIGVRESTEIEAIKEAVHVPVKRVLDPTFLLDIEKYKKLMLSRVINEPYLLLYSRRYDDKLYETAECIARKYGLKIVEISLDIRNADKHILKYSAGVEEFLSLVYYSEYIITNSLHGMIFSIIFNKDFYVFPRIHGERKIKELLDLININDRLLYGIVKDDEITSIEYEPVNDILANEIDVSKKFLFDSLSIIKEQK